MKVYLDNAATTRPFDEVINIMSEIQREDYGNPSSYHSMGLIVEKAIKKAANTIGKTLGSKSENIVFTSGGTESNNMALIQPFPHLDKIKGSNIIISSVEHPAVYAPSENLKNSGAGLVSINVDEHGVIDTESLASSIDSETAIISVMTVNNEVGTIQPIKEICSVKKDASFRMGKIIIFHTDAVQAYGKIPIDLEHPSYSAVDLVTISAHKIHGPKGVGALYVRNIAKTVPFIRGGGQQNGYRSGTENVAGMTGFGCAADIQFTNLQSNMEKISQLRQTLLEGLMERIKNISVNSPIEASLTGEAGKCIPSILSVSFLGTRGEVILHSLEQNGIYVSTESACSSKTRGKSPVLEAMGKTDEEIEGTIRFSLSEFNTKEEIEYTVEKTQKAVDKFRKLTGY